MPFSSKCGFFGRFHSKKVSQKYKDVTLFYDDLCHSGGFAVINPKISWKSENVAKQEFLKMESQ